MIVGLSDLKETMPVIKDRFPKGLYLFDPTKRIKTGADRLPGKEFPGPKPSKDLIKKVNEKAKGFAERAGIQAELKKQELHNQSLAELSRLRGHAAPVQGGMVESRIHLLKHTLGYK
jgi:hypothetical protein